MDSFINLISNLSKRVERIKDNVHTEEATKTSLIMPFFQTLGYDVFNPEEFVPEYVADVGIKKGEKVDYAILQDGEPVILIEAKSISESLEKHSSQLFRYFGTTNAKFAILTNGVDYRFYTDLEEQNKMDKVPFFEFNLLDIKDNQINELLKFKKDNFSVENIMTTASELKYTKEITQYLERQWDNPSDEFVSVILSEIYPGKKTKQVLERFNLLVKKSLRLFVNDMLNDKIKAAFNNSPEQQKEIAVAEEDIERKTEPQIVTTEEEIEGYVTVKLMLSEVVDPSRVYYRDNLSYCNVLLDDNIRKWICRLGFNTSNKYLQFNDDNRTTVNVVGPTDIPNYKDKIIEVAKSML